MLGILPLQAVEILLEVDASTAAFFFFFPSFLFPPYFLVLHMDAGREEGSGESREVCRVTAHRATFPGEGACSCPALPPWSQLVGAY